MATLEIKLANFEEKHKYQESLECSCECKEFDLNDKLSSIDAKLKKIERDSKKKQESSSATNDEESNLIKQKLSNL